MNRESYFQDKDANVGAGENIENNTLESNFSKEKSILFLFVVIVVAIIGISYVKDNFLNNYFKKSNPLAINTEQSGGYLETYDPIKNSNEDTDGDGVANWREVVAGTNPEDKNSVSDSGLQKNILVTATTSLTKLAAADLYTLSKYKEKYPNMNTDSLTAGLAANYENLILPKRIIDISTADSKEITYLKGYGNSMAAMFAIILSNNKFVELTEVQEKVPTFIKTKEYLLTLEKVCDVNKVVKNVPSSYAELHKDFVYNCELYASVLKSMMAIDEDKIRFLIAAKKQEETVRNIFSNFNSYSDRLKSDSVFFKSNENGYVFINKIN